MWTPTEIEALPSAEDVEYAKKAIKELENLLAAAIEAFEQAKLQVVRLEKDIEARRAWLAPIRKLPVEILSEIFVYGSRMSYLMPVIVTEVSRHWRRIVLATPKAWSMIELGHLSNEHEYISTFMGRSNPSIVHVYLDEGYETRSHYDNHPLGDAPRSFTRRIGCLFIPYRLLADMNNDVFPHLTNLTLTGHDPWRTSYFNRSRFPCLRYFNSGHCRWLCSTDTKPLFPLLVYLVIDADSGPGHIEFIKGCSATLRGLEVNLDQKSRQSVSVGIHFPLLEYLGISPWYHSSAWPVQATTPALRSCQDIHFDLTAPDILHSNVKNVTHLQCWNLPPLQPLAALRVLQLPVSAHALGLVENLQCHEEVCPELQSIEFLYEYGPKGVEIEEALIKAARPHIEVTFSDSWSRLPGSRQEYECIHAAWDKK